MKSSGYSYPAHVEVTTKLAWNLPTEIKGFMELLLWKNNNNNHFLKPVQNVILSFGCVKKSNRPYLSFSSLKINCKSSSGSLIQSLCLFYLHYILACSGNKTNSLPHVKMCLITYKTTSVPSCLLWGSFSINAELHIQKCTQTKAAVKIRFTIFFRKESCFFRLSTDLSESIKTQVLFYHP